MDRRRYQNYSKKQYPKKQYIYVKKEKPSQLSPVQPQLSPVQPLLPQLLPDDMLYEIFSHLSLYDQLLVCQLNKNIKCNKNVEILKHNIKLPKIAVDKSSYIIKDDKLYTNVLVKDDKIYKKNFYEIDVPDKPIAVSCHEYDYCVLTVKGLYYKYLYRDMNGDKYMTDYKQIPVNDKIVSFYMHDRKIYIAIPEHIIIYEPLYDRQNILNLAGCLKFISYNINTILCWTKNGLYILRLGYQIHNYQKLTIDINIDNIDENILDVTTAVYNRCYILTTGGLYMSYPKVLGGLASLNECTFELITSEKIKKIDRDYILTLDGKLLKQNYNDYDLVDSDITDIVCDDDETREFSYIAKKNNEYYAYGPKFNKEELTKITL